MHVRYVATLPLARRFFECYTSELPLALLCYDLLVRNKNVEHSVKNLCAESIIVLHNLLEELVQDLSRAERTCLPSAFFGRREALKLGEEVPFGVTLLTLSSLLGKSDIRFC